MAGPDEIARTGKCGNAAQKNGPAARVVPASTEAAHDLSTPRVDRDEAPVMRSSRV